jgi:hypothetical protein
MKMRPHMPAAAIWLLKVFKVPESNPALAGDLTEEYLGGRSSVWLWRQVLAAIAFAVGKEIYGHRLLTIRSLIIGEAAVWLSSWAIYTALAIYGALYGHSRAMLLIPVYTPWQLFYWAGRVYMLPGSMLVFMFGGWIVGLFHRDHRTVLVFLFAMLQFIVVIVQAYSEFGRLLVNSIDQPRFRPYLVANIALFLLCPIGVLLGGYLARSRAEDRSPMPRPLNS